MAAEEDNVDYYANVDPENILYRDQDIAVKRDNEKAWFSVRSPPLALIWSHLKNEGDLGRMVRQANGQMKQIDRNEAKFSFTMSMGWVDEKFKETHPTMLAKQRAFFTVAYKAACAVLAGAFDKRTSMLKGIRKAEEEVLSRRALIAQAMKDTTKDTVDKIEELMRTDAAFRAEIRAEQRKEFVKRATKNLPNPDLYDEEGHIKKRGEDGKDRVISYPLTRKVWRRKREFGNLPKEQMPAPVSHVTLPHNPGTWPRIHAGMTHWEYNPFRITGYKRVHDAATGESKMAAVELKPDPIQLPNGTTIPNPTWDVMENKLTLGKVSLVFKTYEVDETYGVKAVPSPDIVIMYQRPFSGREEGHDVDMSLVAETEPVSVAPVPASPAAPPAVASDEPDAKRQRTSSASPSRDSEPGVVGALTEDDIASMM